VNACKPWWLLSVWAVALTVAQATPLAAQQPRQTVRGVVRDTAGAPLPGADVVLGARKAVTNALGVFRIDTMPVGQFALTIRMVGYEPVRSVVAVVAAEPTELEYLMVPTPFLLDPVIVEGRRTGIWGVVGDTSYRAARGATVQVLGTRGGTTLTDSMGRFGFPEADRGPYMVRVTMPGYAERLFLVELGRGEGRELAVMLTPGRPPGNRAEWALASLEETLVWGQPRLRLTRSELARYGSLALCDLPRIAQLDGRTGRDLTVILNGTTIVRTFSLCSWRIDEIDLIQFGEQRTRGPGGSNRAITTVTIWERR
jgi:hypothetical protein